MKAQFLRGLVASVSALLAAPALALVIDFNGSGTVSPIGPPDAGGNIPLLAISAGGYTLDGESGWSLSSPFSFNFATNSGSGTFSFSKFGDSLTGSLSTTGILVPEVPAPVGFNLSYSILGGTGRFSGASGWGISVVLLDPSSAEPPFAFTERGRFTVPEPATWALLLPLLIGLAALRPRAARAPATP
jgi:hypothetical protein